MASRSLSLRRLRTHASKLSAGDQEGHHHSQQRLVSTVNKLPALRLACCNHEINLLLFNRGQLQLDRVTPGARTTTLRTRARAPLINTFETNALGFRLLKTRRALSIIAKPSDGGPSRSAYLDQSCCWLAVARLCGLSSLRQGALLRVSSPSTRTTSANSCKGSFQNTCLNPSVTMTGSLAARRDRGLSTSEGPALAVASFHLFTSRATD